MTDPMAPRPASTELHLRSEIACSCHEDHPVEESGEQSRGPLGIGPARVWSLTGAT